jgi:predicted nuclease of predicted toxin-antitoxin system
VKFKVDENLPIEVAALLHSAGHDALSVFDQHLVGETDNRLLNVCQKEKRALITLDLDFSDVRSYPPQEHSGLVVLRLQRQDKPFVLETIRRIIPLFEKEQTEHRLWIVEENRIRIRGEGS